MKLRTYNYCKAGFGVIAIFSQKSPNLHGPKYMVLPYCMILQHSPLATLVIVTCMVLVVVVVVVVEVAIVLCSVNIYNMVVQCIA